MGAASADVKSIFGQAMAVSSPAERAAYLQEACGGDPRLRAEVEALLHAYRDAGSFLGERSPSPAATVDQRALQGPGTMIGPYTLREQLGEGGMGLVYVAEQQHPIRRKVALKVIKPGMDTRQVVARFEAERQALALMDHPHIARVLDGGETAGGQPYFVMELVRGVPITQFCDENRLTTRARLELFVSVCQAVQHAHQKGIIHRDLKPSNVLVTSHDGTPVAKVIDFGVAKAVGQSLTDKTVYTQFDQLVGTPLYMSPEQAGQSGLDIDTRSDIYALGVLLYELLTGTTPFDKERLLKAGYDELRRIIREEEPPRPSTRINTLGQSATTVSAQRQSDPWRLSRLYRGELDWIVMKCLEKDRNRRYETANALAADVQRYLNEEAVEACPPSALYRCRKFARRNKSRLAAVAGLFLIAAVIAGSLGYQALDGAVRTAEQASAKAARQAETSTLVTAALAQAELHLAEGDKQMDNPARWQLTVGQAVAAVQRAEELLATGEATEELANHVGQARVAVDVARTDSQLLADLARIRLEMTAVKGDSFSNEMAAPRYKEVLGRYGIDLATPEVAARRVRDSRLRETLLAALADWWRYPKPIVELEQLEAVLQAAELNPDAFQARWRAALLRQDGKAMAQMAALPEVQDMRAVVLAHMADELMRFMEWAAAERLLRAGQEHYRDDFWLNTELGLLLLSRPSPRPEEAVRYLMVALALRRDSPGAHLNLGTALRDTKDTEGAIREYQAALRIDPNYAMAHANLGLALLDKNDLDGAERECQDALRINPSNFTAHLCLGAALRKKRDLEGAVRELKAAVSLDPKSLTAYLDLGAALRDKEDWEGAVRASKAAMSLDPNSAAAHNLLGTVLLAQNDVERAILEFQAALRIEPNSVASRNNLALALHRQNDLEGAIRELQVALRLDPNYLPTYYNLGGALMAKNDLEGAIREYRAAVGLDPNSATAHYSLGSALLRKNDLEGAIREYQIALRFDPNYAEAHCNLAAALNRQGRFVEALAAYKAGHKLGSQQPGWRYPSADWVRKAEQCVQLDGRLPKILAGESQPADTAERLEFAYLCQHPSKQFNAAAARLFSEVFAAEPKRADDLAARHRYNAACAAALAGGGQGKDASKLEGLERARWRRQALEWLLADLAAYRKQLERDAAKAGPAVRRTMQMWLTDPDFVGVRGADALAKLPEAERQPWQKLWAEAQELSLRGLLP